MHRPSTSACQVVFLDAGTLPCGLPFELYLDDALLGRLAYVAHERTLPSEVAERLAHAEVVVTNKVRLSAELLAQAPGLKRICIAAAGMDNVDLQAARALGITVHNVPDYGSDSVAEHVVATLLALRRHLADYSAAAQDGRWAASPHFCWHGPRILPVAGAVLGIVGRGRIGQATARLAQGLGMRVLFAQRPGRDAADDERPLDTLLAQCDALSLHVPLTPDTRGLIDARRLALMKPDAVLINTGRGALLDPHALVAALRAGRLAGAAIDVLEVEPPPPDHPLLAPDIPNLLLTPHVAWASAQAQQRLASRLAELVAQHLREGHGPSSLHEQGAA
ncbi:MAG: D-2-hydroxyacid dehydrogenase [Aquabacterium sp.]|nr:D-2-hydroxyacid dehydrogenase [Aquabacterium sp.]